MREESGYRPAVLSVSGARGLLQIMIPTGERLARIVGRDSFDPDDLFDAQTNIELGAAYLGELSARFPEAPAAAIASYNAGPVAVAEWLADRGSADDVWVEAIPYEQTRHYVKRVLRSLHVYRVLY
jgi:soluble lytic murein transglycosylase